MNYFVKDVPYSIEQQEYTNRLPLTLKGSLTLN